MCPTLRIWKKTQYNNLKASKTLPCDSPQYKDTD